MSDEYETHDQFMKRMMREDSEKRGLSEIELLKNLYDQQLEKFKQSPKLAYNIFKNGKKPRDKSLNLYKTAALSMVANVMLNHDEVYIKR